MINNDDIQAEENKRREVAVKAGDSAIRTKYEHSPYKELQLKLAEQNPNVEVEKEFGELVSKDPKPGFNFVPPISSLVTVDEIKDKRDEFTEAAKAEEKNQRDLQKKAAENELKVTGTSTGQPKVPNADLVQEPSKPVAGDIGGKSTELVNPSPAGSGDAKSVGGAVVNKK